MNKQISATDKLRAQSLNRTGLEHFERWELESAVTLFQEAARLDNTEAEYPLNLARVQVRMGDYEAMLQALGDYLGIEQNQALINRFEMLFSNALDDVESQLTTVMPQENVTLDIIGAAIQMWVEYRVTIGKAHLDLQHPEEWAAALDYTVRKVNVEDVPADQVAAQHKTTETAVKQGYNELVKSLDIMPCDYRYFRGEENPLDKLVEAAMMLEDLEERFRSH